MVRALLVNPVSAVRWGAWVLFAALVIALIYVGTKPEVGGLFPAPWDKLVHFSYFGGLTVVALIGQGGRYPLLCVLLIGVFGAVDEIGQSLNPTRVASAADWSMDLLGAVCAMFMVQGLQRWARADRRGGSGV